VFAVKILDVIIVGTVHTGQYDIGITKLYRNVSAQLYELQFGIKNGKNKGPIPNTITCCGQIGQIC
jgi:hypothetical protein